MSATIAVISDLHFDQSGVPHPERRGDLADILFQRAVDRLNESIRPDVLLLPGDMVDQGGTSAARDCLKRLRSITDLIECPIIAIPGNHDGAPDVFYAIFDRPPLHLDVKGVRFVPFLDPEEPGWNARREPHDIARMANARVGFDGPIVAVQHVPLCPPGQSYRHFNYTNANDIIAAMRTHGYVLSVSGHYHPGMELVQAEGIGFVAAPALCERPFRFLEVTLGNSEVSVCEHALLCDETDGDPGDILLEPRA